MARLTTTLQHKVKQYATRHLGTIKYLSTILVSKTEPIEIYNGEYESVSSFPILEFNNNWSSMNKSKTKKSADGTKEEA